MDTQKLLKLGFQQVLDDKRQKLLSAQASEKSLKLFARKADEFVDKKEEKSKLEDLDDLINQT